MRTIVNVVIGLLILNLAPAPSEAAALLRIPEFRHLTSAKPMPFGGAAAVPRGYYELCRKNHSICRIVRARGVPTTSNGAVVATDAALQRLASVNVSVNRSMKERADSSRDIWTVGTRTGDCEDFALTKKQRLVNAGFPSSALLVALAKTRSGRPHAVLIARTDRGDFVLDNLTNEIRAWNRAGLRWVMVQSPEAVWAWHKL